MKSPVETPFYMLYCLVKHKVLQLSGILTFSTFFRKIQKFFKVTELDRTQRLTAIIYVNLIPLLLIIFVNFQTLSYKCV